LRKILEAFRTLPIAAMEMEAKLPPADMRLQQKSDKYAIRLATLAENYPTRMRIPSSFTPQYNTGTETNKEIYLDWDENEPIEPIGANLPTKTKRSRKNVENILHKGTEC